MNQAVNPTTESQQLEAELQTERNRFHTLVEAVKEYAIFMLDPDGHIPKFVVNCGERTE